MYPDALHNTISNSHVTPFYTGGLLMGLQEAVIAEDRSMTILTWNPAAEKIFCIKAADALGKQFRSVLHFEYPEGREQMLNQLHKNGYWKDSFRFKRNDGKEIQLLVSYTVVRDGDQKHLGYIASIRDITKEHSDNKQLVNIKRLLEEMESGFFIIDRESRILYSNKSGKEISAKIFHPPLVENDIIPQVLDKSMRGLFFENMHDAFNGEIVSCVIDYEATEDHEAGQVSFTYTPLFNDKDAIDFLSIRMKDNAQQKRFDKLTATAKELEKELYQSREVFELFMESSPLCAWITDEDGKLHYTNPAFLTEINVTDPVIGKSIFELYPGNVAERFHRNNKLVLTTGNVVTAVEETGDDARHKKTFQVVKFPLHYKGTTMVAGWSVDISERIEYHEKLLNLSKERRRETILSVVESREKERATIAADLRDKVNQTLALCKILLQDEKVVSLSPTIAAVKNHIHEAIDELNMMSMNLSPSIIEDISFMAGAWDFIESLQKHTPIIVNLECVQDTMEELEPADKLSIFRIMQSFIQMVVQAGKAKTVTITIEVRDSKLCLLLWCDDHTFIFPANSKEYEELVHRMEYCHGVMKVSRSDLDISCTIELRTRKKQALNM